MSDVAINVISGIAIGISVGVFLWALEMDRR